jgi:FtsZ-binding cell division protein ZapB
MQLVKWCIFFCLVVKINTVVISQINYSFKTITNNSNTSYVDSIKKTLGRSVIFFCPTNDIDSTIFKTKGKELVTNKKINAFNEIKVHFILFKEDPKNNAKGIPLANSDKTISFPISQLECFFLNFDKEFLKRARTKDKFNFEYKQPFPSENFFRIQIVDTNKCFKEIPDRIPFYADFIKEAYSPSYSLEEKVDFLADSIKILQRNVTDLKEINKEILFKLDSILKQNNISSPKKLKSEKIINQNPNKDQPQIPLENKPNDAIIDPNLKVNNKGKNK